VGGKTIRSFILQTNGKTLIINPDTDDIKQETVCEVQCDSRRCESRHGKKTSITWIEEKVSNNIEVLPDAFFNFIKVCPDPMNQNEQIVVCSAQCLKDWATYDYIPPKTKKEWQERLKVPAETQAAIDALDPQMKLPFEKGDA
jgi:hypothetical protein